MTCAQADEGVVGTKRVQIAGRINDDVSDYLHLFDIYHEAVNSGGDIEFDFSQCKFLRPNAVAYIGGLARLVEHRGHKATFLWDTISDSWIQTTLRQNGFAYSFGDDVAPWDGHSIPYREDLAQDPDAIFNYLTDNWIGKGWVHISERLRDAVAGRMWEIFCNAFEHSGSKIGVFACGQHYKTLNTLLLSVVDFGSGIPARVRSFTGVDPRARLLPSSACLKWAFMPGNSTAADVVPRGLGLDLLKEFVKVNAGKLEVYSNNAYACIDSSGERYRDLSSGFSGTIVHVTLKCDECLYMLSEEARQ